MAFYKWALAEIGCFDPMFDKAGDDVDLCWRLQQRGWQIGFSPGGFVWHCRRSTVAAYLEQQRGYGEAEAMLARRHPEYFNSFGGSVWRGRIYGAAGLGLALRRPVIYRGLFATGLFQSLYRAAPAGWPLVMASLEYHALVNLPLLVLSVPFHWFRPLAAASLGRFLRRFAWPRRRRRGCRATKSAGGPARWSPSSFSSSPSSAAGRATAAASGSVRLAPLPGNLGFALPQKRRPGQTPPFPGAARPQARNGT